jgi:hypothetical protein
LFSFIFWFKYSGIVLSEQALSNLVCSEQLKIFFIGSIIALIALYIDLGSKYVTIDEDIHDKNAYLRLGIFWIFTLVWACLGVVWIQNVINCNTNIIRSANIVLSILFINYGIVIILVVLMLM